MTAGTILKTIKYYKLLFGSLMCCLLIYTVTLTNYIILASVLCCRCCPCDCEGGLLVLMVDP